MARRGSEGSAPKGLHLVHGDKDNFDSWIAERALEEILQSWLGSERTPDSVETLRGEDRASWPQVASAVCSASLFAPRRVVVVRRAEQVLKGEDESMGEALLAALPRRNQDVCLVVMAAKPDKKFKLWKTLLDRCVVHLALPLKPAAAQSFLREELRRRKLSLPEPTIAELVERVGQDLRRLVGEIDKLELLAAGERLTVEQAAESLGRALGRPPWDLADAFGNRDLPASLALLDEHLEAREAPIFLHWVILNVLRQIRVARALGRNAGAEAASFLEPRNVGKVLEWARRWSAEDVERAYAALEEADRLLKLGGEPKSVLTTALVRSLRSTARPGETRPEGRGAEAKTPAWPRAR